MFDISRFFLRHSVLVYVVLQTMSNCKPTNQPTNQPTRTTTHALLLYIDTCQYFVLFCCVGSENAGMSARCSSLVSFLLVCFTVIPHATWSSPQHPSRRCFSGWNNFTIALLDDLSQSICQPCDPSQYLPLSTKLKKDVSDVGIVLPHTESLMEPYFVTSTAL